MAFCDKLFPQTDGVGEVRISGRGFEYDSLDILCLYKYIQYQYLMKKCSYI